MLKQMDRSWIHGRRFTPAYVDGVEQFMEFVRGQFPADSEIHCPYRRCLNQTLWPQHEVNDHIHIFGMSLLYTRWVHHGESPDGQVAEFREEEVQPDEYDDGGGIHLGEDDQDHDQADDQDDDHGVTEMISDLYTAVEEDGGTPSFAKVLADGKRSLCPGSAHSRFSFLVRLLYMKSRYRLGNNFFTALLKLLSDAFPQCQFPKSYDEAKKYLRELGIAYESIHVCKNNCVLFRKSEVFDTDYVNLEACPVCDESRWEGGESGRRVPHKVLRHFPLIPRLKRMFAMKRTAEEAQWHKVGRKPVANEMSHPADGEAWKDFDRKYQSFAADARNLRLSLATDGFNPFGNMSTQYSMWPVLVTPLNLPPWECVNSANCFMSLLIPGPSSPGKDFDLFLEPLIEELLALWKGVSTYDAVSGKKFDLRAAVLWCIHDYPALSTLSGRTTKGYYACIHCDKNPLSRALRGKIAYIGHRRFLPKDHEWWKILAFVGCRETRDAPGKFSSKEVQEELEKVKDVRPGKHPAPAPRKRKRGEKSSPKIWSRKVGLWKLPYWKDLLLPHNLDVMHIEKNICDALLGILLKIEGKNKDTENARLDLYDMGIRHEFHLREDGDGCRMPEAFYVLNKENRTRFCKFLKGVKFPHGYAANLGRFISADGTKLQGRLKTHCCHVLLQKIMPAGLRGLVRQDVYEAIAELGDFFRELCSRNLKIDVVKGLKEKIPVILCKLEKIFPPAFFDVMVHLAVHLPDEALLRGPVQYEWMYPIERRLGTLKNFVSNRARPEGSIAEAYGASDTLTFCSRYMADVDTKFNSNDAINVDEPLDSDPEIFKHGVKLVGADRRTYIDDKMYFRLVWYVLNNCTEAEPYVE